METKFVVKTAAACMPSSCWGNYGKVAVLEIDPSLVPDGGPKMISTHARGVVAVVHVWDRLNVGTTDSCAFRRALTSAEKLCERLNADLILREERKMMTDPYGLKGINADLV